MADPKHIDPIILSAIKSLDTVKVCQKTLILTLKSSFEEGKIDSHPRLTGKIADIVKNTDDKVLAIHGGEALEEAGLSESGDKYIIGNLFDIAQNAVTKNDLFIAAKMTAFAATILSRKPELAETKQLENFLSLSDKVIQETAPATPQVKDSWLSNIFRLKAQESPLSLFKDELNNLQSVFDVIEIEALSDMMKKTEQQKGLVHNLIKPVENALPKNIKRFIKDIRRK